jgi:hypothetical protein
MENAIAHYLAVVGTVQGTAIVPKRISLGCQRWRYSLAGRMEWRYSRTGRTLQCVCNRRFFLGGLRMLLLANASLGGEVQRLH